MPPPIRRRWELAFWALALAATAAWSFAPRPAPAPTATQQDGVWLSDVDGALAALHVQVDPDALPLVLDTYEDLLNALAPDVRVSVAVADPAHFEQFRAALAARGVGALDRLHPAPVGRPISTWGRDRYLVRTGAPRAGLLVPRQPTDASSAARRGDWFVAWALARAAPAERRVVPVPLRFDGGDFLATGTTLFCDAHLIEKNVPDVFPTVEALCAWLAETSGLRVELIGRNVADLPDHHVGMYLSALPDGRLIVADARAFSDDVEWEAARAAGLRVRRSEEFARQCDFVADWLTCAGYAVLRMPIAPTEDARAWVTYNNVLFETRAAGHVFLPQYGFEPWDARARAQWEALGVQVHPIRVREIFVHRGSVRCLAQILERQ